MPRRHHHVFRVGLAAVLVAIAAVLLSERPAHAQEGAMAVDCEGNSRSIQRNCQFGVNQEFTISVQAAEAPEGGYLGFQLRLRWDSGVLTYLPTDEAAGEVVWEHCNIPARNHRSQDAQTGSVLFACLAFPLDPLPRFDDTGPLVLFTLACTRQGTAQLTLVGQEPGANQPDTGFVNADQAAIVEPALTGATVQCGSAPVPRPTADVRPNPPDSVLTEDTAPEFEATASAGLDDDDGDGQMTEPQDGDGAGSAQDETPAAPTSEATDGAATDARTRTPSPADRATGTPDPDGLSEEEDGGGTAVWVWVIVGLAGAGGLGGAGYLAWRRFGNTNASA